MRSGSSRHRGYRLPRYGHSQNFGRAAIGRFHAFASKTTKSQERLRNRQGRAAVERDESSAQTILESWSDRPLRRALNAVRVSVDPFRDVVRRIFPGKTTVFLENPQPTGCSRITFRVVRTLVRLDFWTTRTRDVGSHALVSNKIGTWPRFRGLVYQPLTCERHVESSSIATRAASDSFDPRGRRILLRTRPERRRRW